MKSITLTVTLVVALILLVGGGAYYALVLIPPSEGYANTSSEANANTNGVQARPAQGGTFLCESDEGQRRQVRDDCVTPGNRCAAQVQKMLIGKLPAGATITLEPINGGKRDDPIWMLTASRQSGEKTVYDYHPCSGALRER